MDDAVALCLAVVARRCGVDFRDARRPTVERAVGERLRALGLSDAEYCKRLETDAAEVATLSRTLVVPYTRFFRDVEVFDALAGWAGTHPGTPPAPLRAWVVGVATGEEAWSLAMLLAESLGVGGPWEVLATDIEQGGLEFAAAGRYRPERIEGVPTRFRERWLVPVGGELEVATGLRPHVHFEWHDVTGRTLAPAHSVVARFGLVMCRNVLIYLEPRLQAKVLDRLAAVLAPGGLLVLGSAELLPSSDRRLGPAPGFGPVARAYQRKGDENGVAHVP